MIQFRHVRSLICLCVAPLLLSVASGTYAQNFAQNQQHPLVDTLANKVILKYQTSSCTQLRLKKLEKEPPSAQQQKIIQYMKNNPQMRTYFINKVAAPIANKMFECGMIP
ncbi:MAG TPA: hypothetical protein VHX63_16630 [Acidobacteriaceae bacterium]|nr:hypothetical protein [Acidobacteriaceae bacterium]